MIVASLDHLVITVADIELTCSFYSKVLGMRIETFQGGRKALHFGTQKINVHQIGQEIEPHAHRPAPGSADLCFLIETRIEDVHEHLAAHGVDALSEIVDRTGAQGPIQSVYFRDPDGNLLEVSVLSVT